MQTLERSHRTNMCDMQCILKRKMVIRQTWSMIECKIGCEATERFYEVLFRNYTHLKPLFRDADMKIQAHKLYEVFQIAVRFLDDMEALRPFLEEMGVRHSLQYGVIRAHYEASTDVFIYVLADYFRKSQVTTPAMGLSLQDIVDSWTWLLSQIGTIMADAADKVVALDSHRNKVTNFGGK